MHEFTLCFPLPCSSDAVVPFLLEKGLTSAVPEEHSLWFAGESYEFWYAVQPPNEGIVQAFQEHYPLNPAETECIGAHRSLLFLRGVFKNVEHFRAVNRVIRALLQAARTGVYLDHCGCAYPADHWLAEMTDQHLEGWINLIYSRGSLWTLGLEVFQMPDLAIQCAEQNLDMARDFLMQLAEASFLDGYELSSGLDIDDLSGITYRIQQEPKPLYPRGDELYNSLGTWRLVRKK